MSHPRTSGRNRVAVPLALGTTGLVALTSTAALAVPAGGYADLIETLSPAVVLVEVTAAATPADATGQMPNDEFFNEFLRRFGDQLPQMPQAPGSPDRHGVGSGFIISADGLIVTNNHVIDGATTVSVQFADGSEHEATIVGRDPLTDLALLDIEGTDLPTVAFGSSDDMRVGDEVIAMGNPFGLGGTVTTGIVSAMDRNINAGPFDEFIQTDAAINRGNSGGPLFNAQGEVIGVNTAIFSPNGASAGIGFAVPSDVVSVIVADLQDDGRIDRGWLGVQIKPVSAEVASVLGLEAGQGTMIDEVMSDTPAELAGLRAGDIVLSFDGADITDTRDLTRAVASAEPGSSSTIEVLRHGERLSLEVVLANRASEQEA